MTHLPEPLNLNSILAIIPIENRSYLSKLDIFEVIDSTNSYLLQRAKQGAPSGSICLADQQTSGRGRFGRKWLSPPGANIYCSLLWRFTDFQADLSSLSLAIAVIVAKMLEKQGISNIQVKWPNDLFFLGKKLGGILLERGSSNGVVVGIGLNLLLSDEHMKDPLLRATSLHEILKAMPDRNFLIGSLINELLSQLLMFEEQGLKPFMKAWAEMDMLAGKQVTVHLPEGSVIEGMVSGINEHGELLLVTDHGIRWFRSGEVSMKL